MLLFATVLTLLPASAAEAGPKGFVINASGSDKCLDVPANNGRVGVRVTIYTCHGQESQQFAKHGSDIQHVSSGLCLGYSDRGGRRGDLELRPCNEAGPTFGFIDVGNGDVQLKSWHSNPDRCLDRSGGSLDNGTKVVYWSCHGGQHQKWKLAVDWTFTIAADGTNQCIDVPGNARVGIELELWPCHGGDRQQFVERGTEIVHEASGLCIGYENGTSRNGGNAELRNCSEAGPNFRWGVFGNAYEIVGRHSNPDRCLDREGGSSSSGTDIIFYGCHGEVNQRWTRVIQPFNPERRYVTHHADVYTSATSRQMDNAVSMEWWVKVSPAEEHDATLCNGRGFGACVYFPMMQIALDAPASGTHIGPQLANAGPDQFGERWLINYGLFYDGYSETEQWTGFVPENSWIGFRFIRQNTFERNGQPWSTWAVRARLAGSDRLLGTVELAGEFITHTGVSYESLEYGGDACVTSAPNVDYLVDRYQTRLANGSWQWRDFYGTKADYSGGVDEVCNRDKVRLINNDTGHIRFIRYDDDTFRQIRDGQWITQRP